MQPSYSSMLVMAAIAIAAASLCGTGSVVIALKKEQHAVSRGGLVLGAVGFLISVRLCYSIEWRLGFTVLAGSITAVLLLGALALLLSLRTRGSGPSLLAASLATVFSPMIVRHACGLRSWPLEVLITLIWAVAAFRIVSKVKRRWLAWTIASLLVAPSGLITGAYLQFLHSDSFPYVLLDHSGRIWRSDLDQHGARQQVN